MSDDLNWRPVGHERDWPADGGKVVQVGARRVGVYRHAGKWYALKDICPHAGVSLAKGPVRDGVVMCIGHGWTFSLASGDLVSGPAGFSVATYAVRQRDDGTVEVGT
ncbi:hypothetical protein LBMAG53_08180 [Planctomycetota bacterium]|nr:hypothetical protein LBMAG53_08180 [Planctomycetota bacterium]